MFSQLKSSTITPCCSPNFSYIVLKGIAAFSCKAD